MRQLVLFMVSALHIDKYSKIVGSGRNSDARACKFCTELIKAPSRNSFLRTIDPKGGNRGVVRGLLREVGDFHRLIFRTSLVDGRYFMALSKNCRLLVLDNPITLLAFSKNLQEVFVKRTRKNSPRVELYGLQGLPLTYFCPYPVSTFHDKSKHPACLTRSLVNQNLKTASMRPRSSSESPMLRRSLSNLLTGQATQADLMNVSGLSR